MKVICKACGALHANMYVIGDDEGNAVVIDPISLSELERILNENSLWLSAIFLTHAHFDHAQELTAIQDMYHVPSYVHEDDSDAMTNFVKNASVLFGDELVLGRYITEFKDGSSFFYGDIELIVHHTPGHSPGSVCYEVGDCLFTGDTLFARGIGRTDFMGGDRSALHESLEIIAELDKNFIVYPGHGPATTLDEEKQFNPVLKLKVKKETK